eukprot:jgi/Botrbrau1/14317/Bobra.0287s0010.1
MDFVDYSSMDPPRRHGVATYFDLISSPINRLAVSDFLSALVDLSAASPDAIDIPESSRIQEVSPSPPPAAPDAIPDQIGWGRSNSVMFLLYMVIGFTVTLAAILGVLTSYYVLRYCFSRPSLQRRREESFTIGPEPKEIFVVVHPGGNTDVAYREGKSPVKMVQRGKEIPVRYAYVPTSAADGVESSSGSFSIPACHDCTSGDSPQSPTVRALPQIISLHAVAVGPNIPPAEPWIPETVSGCRQSSQTLSTGEESQSGYGSGSEPCEGSGQNSRSCHGQHSFEVLATTSADSTQGQH